MFSAEPVVVAVVGGGIMGRGIALAFARVGHPVTVFEPDEAAAAAIASHLEADLRAAGDTDPTEVVARVAVSRELASALTDAAIVIEAVPERMVLKKQVWRDIDAAVGPDVVLATNTSALDIDEIASVVRVPERFLGTHWFNPAHVVPGVEIVRGRATSDAVAQWTTAVVRNAGKTAVVVSNSPGFIANRIQFAMVREALLCLEEGLASAEDIDAIISGTFGPRLAVLGPLALADLGGLDTYRSILDFLTEQLGERFAVPALLDRLVSEGRLGVKSGAGIATYTPEEAAELTARRDQGLLRVVAAASEGA